MFWYFQALIKKAENLKQQKFKKLGKRGFKLTKFHSNITVLSENSKENETLILGFKCNIEPDSFALYRMKDKPVEGFSHKNA